MEAPAPPDLGPVRRVILQSTSFCNIDCTYCYLPDRDKRTVMPIAVVRAVGDVLARSGILADTVEFRWHAGEPLMAPIDHYVESADILSAALDGHCDVAFSVQTNATPVNDAWCDFFLDRDVDVGVSVDGPQRLHDSHRVTRGGRGTFDRTMAGIDRLRRRGVPFDVISVITDETLRHQEEFVAFVRDLQPRSLGVNPEETEGDHRSELFDDAGFLDRYRAFLGRLQRLQDDTGIPVRRLASMREQVLHGRLPLRNDQIEPLLTVSVDVTGNLSSLSPELLGWPAPRYDDFVFGNVLDPEASLFRWSDGFRRLVDDAAAGRELCRETCAYFSLCGGGAVANKWTEHGTVMATETDACRSNIMAVVDVVLDALEREDPDRVSPVAR
jgi:uncharacterized protein